MTDLERIARPAVLLASYCGDDNPQCTKMRPCPDCLAMCNVYEVMELGRYLREFGALASMPEIAAMREEIAMLRKCLNDFHDSTTDQSLDLRADRDHWKAECERLTKERDSLVLSTGEHITVRSALRAERDHAMAECERLREAITNYLGGFYNNPRKYRPKGCPHGRSYYEECGQCIDEHFEAALKPL